MNNCTRYLGLDVHAETILETGQVTPEFSVLEHDPVAIDAWASKLKQRFGGRPIAVCLELARGPIVSALLEYDFFVIFPINPAMLAKYRRAFSPSRAKDDPKDAFLALDIFRHHLDRLSPLRRERPAMRALQRPEQPLRISSRMPENGVIFSDGIESDFLEFNAGMEARIELAERRGLLVV